MNRRTFTQSLAALFAAPVLPALPLAAPAAVASVPTQARFWAIYFTGLHGKCTPAILQKALNIPALQAEGIIGQLVSEGVIKPNVLYSGVKAAHLKPGPASNVATSEMPKPEPLEISMKEEAPMVSDDGEVTEDAPVCEAEDDLSDSPSEPEIKPVLVNSSGRKV